MKKSELVQIIREEIRNIRVASLNEGTTKNFPNELEFEKFVIKGLPGKPQMVISAGQQSYPRQSTAMVVGRDNVKRGKLHRWVSGKGATDVLGNWVKNGDGSITLTLESKEVK